MMSNSKAKSILFALKVNTTTLLLGSLFSIFLIMFDKFSPDNSSRDFEAARFVVQLSIILFIVMMLPITLVVSWDGVFGTLLRRADPGVCTIGTDAWIVGVFVVKVNTLVAVELLFAGACAGPFVRSGCLWVGYRTPVATMLAWKEFLVHPWETDRI